MDTETMQVRIKRMTDTQLKQYSVDLLAMAGRDEAGIDDLVLVARELDRRENRHRERAAALRQLVAYRERRRKNPFG